jgi:hypothetical protein
MRKAAAATSMSEHGGKGQGHDEIERAAEFRRFGGGPVPRLR